MSTQRSLNGDLGVIALPSARSLGAKIDRHLVAMRAARLGGEARDTYLIQYNAPRFANGEGKLVLDESVRGKDLYILADVGNYGCTYKLFGMETRMGPRPAFPRHQAGDFRHQRQRPPYFGDHAAALCGSTA